MKIFWIAIYLMLLNIGICWSYNWPISDFNGPHPIHGTLGEWRGDRLHAGVDIGCPVNTRVYAINNGVAHLYGFGNNRGVSVGNKEYTHILPAVIDEQEIVAGDLLGHTLLTHLHLEESDGAFNPLRVGGLANYTDTYPPTVSTVEFYRDTTVDNLSESSQTQLAGIIFGKIDILANAKDAQSRGSDTVSVYKIGYQIKNDDGETVSDTNNIQFDNVTNGLIGLVYANFGSRQSNRSNYYYWVTNSATQDEYWNTRLKQGQDWGGSDAKINQEARYPDGKYKVAVRAEDIRGNTATKIQEAIIDNFKPYVRV